MKMKILSAAILTVGLLSATAAVQAATVEYNGDLKNFFDINWGSFVVSNSFDASGVTIYTDSFMDRKHGVGNFDTYLVVWDSMGNFVAYGDDISDTNWDAYIDLGHLADGTYYFTVSNDPYKLTCDNNGTFQNCGNFFDARDNGWDLVYSPPSWRDPNDDKMNPHKWGREWHVVVTGVVPEPETWAMLLAGLGMVGAVARRRRQQV